MVVKLKDDKTNLEAIQPCRLGAFRRIRRLMRLTFCDAIQQVPDREELHVVEELGGVPCVVFDASELLWEHRE